jgi:WD40 repeat protein/uncharacterized caspase-like protein
MKHVAICLSNFFLVAAASLAIAAQRPEVYIQSGHSSAVKAVAISADGRTGASVDDSQIKLWDMASRVELRTISGSSFYTNAVAFSPVAPILATAGGDDMIHLWDLASGKEVRTLAGHSDKINSVLFSPDGRSVISGSDDKTVRFWSVETGAVTRTLSAHSARITSIAVDRGGRFLVTGGWDETVKVWTLETGEPVRTLKSDIGYVDAVAISADGALVAGGGKLWETTAWAESPLVSKLGSASTIAFSADNTKLATNGLQVDVWDLGKNKASRALVGEHVTNQTAVNSLAFTPDGSTIMTGGDDKKIRFWNAEGGKLLNTFEQHNSVVRAGVLSFDGRIAATSGEDKAIIIWDTSTGRQLQKIMACDTFLAALSFSPDGKVLAASCGSMIRLWDVETGTRITELAGHKSFVHLLQFASDGRSLLSASDDGGFESISEEIRTRRPSATRTAKIWSVAEKREINSIGGLGVVFGISPDAKYLAVAKPDLRLTILESASGKSVRTFETLTDAHTGVYFGSSGQLTLVSTGGIRSLNFLANEPERQARGGSLLVSDMIGFTTDGKFFAGRLSARSIIVGETGTGRIVRQLSGNLDDITAVSLSGDGAYVLSAGEDKTARIWKVQDRMELASSTPSMGVHSVDFNKDFDLMALYGAGDGEIAVWDFKIGTRLPNLSGGIQIGGATFHPTEPVIASVDYARTITVWDVRRGTVMKKRQLSLGADFYPTSIRYSFDGTALIVEGGNRYVIWQPGTDSEEVHIRTGVPSAELNARFPQYNFGSVLESRGFIKQEGNRIRVKDPASGKEFFSLFNLPESDWAVVSPDGLFDGSPGGWRQIIWRFDNNTYSYAPGEAFFNEFFRPGLLKDLRQGLSLDLPPIDFASIDIRQPVIRLVSPAENSMSGAASTEIAIEVTANNSKPRRTDHKESAGAQDVRLFRNASLAKKWSGDVFGKGSGCELVSTKPGEPLKAVCKTKVTLAAGDNRFTAYAFNTQNVKSNDATVVVKGADSLKKSGILYVLAVGVDKYAAAGHNLKYAVADANRIGDEIATRQVDIKRYARTEVVRLTDQNATRANVMLALKRFSVDADVSNLPEPLRAELSKIKITGPEDAIVFHFSGHGTARCNSGASGTRNCDRFYLLPHDGFPVGLASTAANYQETMFASSISDEDLERAFEPIDAGNLLMIIDACNSGQALEAEEKRRGPMNSRGLAQLAYEKGMMILTASQSQQAALETSKLGHGLLTYSLVEGLKSADKTDNVIIDRTWFNYASALVPRLQLDEMQKRDAEVKNGTRDIGVNFSSDEEKNLAPEKRLQSPRLFYRREADLNPFIVARP